MRIFYAAPNTAHEDALPSSRLWRANLYLPLVDLGHELVEFAFDYGPFNRHLDPEIPAHRAFIDEHRPRFGEELIRQVSDAHRRRPLDLFFSYFYSAYVEPEVIREIGRMGVPTMNWYCNGSYQMRLVEDIAPAYDWCLVPERYRLDDYRRLGASPIYCQEAANPSIYRPHALPRRYDVTFTGQRYGSRSAHISALVDAGVDVRAWGPHWADPVPPVNLRGRLARFVGRGGHEDVLLPAGVGGPPLSDDEYVRMFSRSKISLGFTELAAAPVDGAPSRQVRLRDFEAPMSGAFYLVEAFDELAEFFVPGREVVFFASRDELVEKARYYLAHEEERERIRQAGLARALADHTWQKRFKDVFETIGIG